MANKYYFTACLKKDDNGGIIMDKRNKYKEAVKDLLELHNNNNRLIGNNISFIGIIKHKANENPLDRIRDLNENLTLDIYTRIVNAMNELRKTNIVSNIKLMEKMFIQQKELNIIIIFLFTSKHITIKKLLVY